MTEHEKEHRRIYQKAYYQRTREKRLAYQNSRDYGPQRQKILTYHRKHNRERYQENAEIVLNHYGRTCVCCGESIRMFLTIDHINNDGNKERQQTKTAQYDLLAKLIRDGCAPTNRQVLCRNCNWGKHCNNGICPHQLQ